MSENKIEEPEIPADGLGVNERLLSGKMDPTALPLKLLNKIRSGHGMEDILTRPQLSHWHDPREGNPHHSSSEWRI